MGICAQFSRVQKWGYVHNSQEFKSGGLCTISRISLWTLPFPPRHVLRCLHPSVPNIYRAEYAKNSNCKRSHQLRRYLLEAAWRWCPRSADQVIPNLPPQLSAGKRNAPFPSGQGVSILHPGAAYHQHYIEPTLGRGHLSRAYQPMKCEICHAVLTQYITTRRPCVL